MITQMRNMNTNFRGGKLPQAHIPGEISVRQAKLLKDSDPKALVNTCFDIGKKNIVPCERNAGLLSKFVEIAKSENKSPDFLLAVQEQLAKVAKGVVPEAPRKFRAYEINAMYRVTRDLPEVARKAGEGTFAPGSGAIAQLRMPSVDYGAASDQVVFRLEDEVMKKSCRNEISPKNKGEIQ